MDGSHQTFDDTEVVVNDLGKRGEAVGRAGMHLRSVVHPINTKMKMDDRCVRTTLTAGSYFSRLTPHTNLGASADGAEMMTFVHAGLQVPEAL